MGGGGQQPGPDTLPSPAVWPFPGSREGGRRFPRDLEEEGRGEAGEGKQRSRGRMAGAPGSSCAGEPGRQPPWDALEKEMATDSSVLAWRIPGTGEPGGLPSMAQHRVGHD